MVAMSKAILRSWDSVTNTIIVERKGSEIINLKSIIPVTELELRAGFDKFWKFQKNTGGGMRREIGPWQKLPIEDFKNYIADVTIEVIAF